MEPKRFWADDKSPSYSVISVSSHLDELSACRTSDLKPSWKLPIQAVNDKGRSHQESTRQFALSFHPQETLEAVEGAASYVSPKTATQV